MDKKEMLEKYGDVKIKFSSYYKYTFSYYGIADDGARISVSLGGDADEIYRLEVTADDTLTLNKDEYDEVSIMHGNKEIFRDSTY